MRRVREMTDFRIARADLQRAFRLPSLAPSPSDPRRTHGSVHGHFMSIVVSQPCAFVRSDFRSNSICHADGSFDNILPLDLDVS